MRSQAARSAGGADAVAEILVEMRRPPVPMGGDLLLDRIGVRLTTSAVLP